MYLGKTIEAYLESSMTLQKVTCSSSYRSRISLQNAVEVARMGSRVARSTGADERSH
jgi:hypothetical protein